MKMMMMIIKIINKIKIKQLYLNIRIIFKKKIIINNLWINKYCLIFHLKYIVYNPKFTKIQLTQVNY